MCCLTSLLFFDSPLFYYYVNLRSASVFLSNPVFSVSLSTSSEVFFGKYLDTFVILSAILLRIKSLVASVVF